MTTQIPPVTLKQIALSLLYSGKFKNISIQDDHVHCYLDELETKVMIIDDAITLRYITYENDVTFETYEEFTNYINF
jgi:hypothetical protein